MKKQNYIQQQQEDQERQERFSKYELLIAREMRKMIDNLKHSCELRTAINQLDMEGSSDRMPTVEDAVKAIKSLEGQLCSCKEHMNSVIIKLNPSYATSAPPAEKQEPVPPLQEIKRIYEDCTILIGDIESRITHLDLHIGWDGPSSVKEAPESGRILNS